MVTAGDAARRLEALSAVVSDVSNRQAGPTVTLADLPHGEEVARQYLALLAGDRLAAIKVHALLAGPPNRGALEYIASQEDRTGDVDSRFWEAIGGRPEVYSPADPRYWRT